MKLNPSSHPGSDSSREPLDEPRQELLALKQDRARHLRLMEVSKVGMWTADEAGQNTYVSPRWCEITGIPADQALGMGWTLGLHPDDRDVVVEVVKKARDHHEAYEAEFRFQHPNGSFVWVRCQASFLSPMDGVPGEWIGTLHDISPQKLAERSLHASEVKYRTLFEVLPVGISVSDKKGHMVDCNHASEALLGLKKEEHERRTIDDPNWSIVRPDGTTMPPEEYASYRALKEKRLVRNVEMGIVKSPDQITWINVTAAPIPLEGYGVAIAYDDITDRKAFEQELEHHRTKLRNLAGELAKTEEKQRRRMALHLHDGVGQLLSVAKIKLRDAESKAETDESRRNLVAIREIIEQALQDTRSMASELTPPLLYEAGLVPALGWLIAHFQSQCPHVIFHLVEEAEPRDIQCRILMFEFARELLFNVIKHSQAHHAWVELQLTDTHFIMRIWDDGIGGVSDETLDSMKQDAGYGLFSIRERLRLYGGELRIHSPHGVGTNVTLSCLCHSRVAL